MIEKPLVFGIIIVVLISFIVYMVEVFIPISKKFDMNQQCRYTLLKMESKGGLTQQDKNELSKKLSAQGFTNVAITGTQKAKQGQDLNIKVEVDFTYSKLIGLLSRKDITQHMVYDKTTSCRMVME